MRQRERERERRRGQVVIDFNIPIIVYNVLYKINNVIKLIFTFTVSAIIHK